LDRLALINVLHSILGKIQHDAWGTASPEGYNYIVIFVGRHFNWHQFNELMHQFVKRIFQDNYEAKTHNVDIYYIQI
jgi:hypothetical protein